MSAATQLHIKFEEPQTEKVENPLPLVATHVTDTDAIDSILLDMLFAYAEKKVMNEQP